MSRTNAAHAHGAWLIKSNKKGTEMIIRRIGLAVCLLSAAYTASAGYTWSSSKPTASTHGYTWSSSKPGAAETHGYTWSD